MRAYYYDGEPGDPRLPHDSGRTVSTEMLEALNVQSMFVPVETYEEEVAAIAKQQGYKNHDIISISKEGLGDQYESRIKAFFHEHMHEDDEARYIITGSGYFDIREAHTNAWVRLAVTTGDLLIVPAGIYHRFTLDTHDRVKSMRLFKDAPKWEALNRGVETDRHPVRTGYLKNIGL
ncbi:Acireductone dioxygenase [Hymenopellis radicata]|nr:Acireductone dioxygenase [Hymenopellis radicata]